MVEGATTNSDRLINADGHGDQGTFLQGPWPAIESEVGRAFGNRDGTEENPSRPRPDQPAAPGRSGFL